MAGNQYAAAAAIQAAKALGYWIPAFAGMTPVFVASSKA
jgi:hypothetical protein